MEELDITSASESSEWGAPSPEIIREKSEKQKESYKKAQAQIQRAQKDERKVKWDNTELFQILIRFIQDPYYESLTPIVTELLTISLPARPIITLLALVYPDATHHVFHATGESERIHLLKTLHHYDEPWWFHESTLHESIRRWMTVWIENLDRYIVLEGTSVVMQKKFSSLIDEKESVILKGITEFVLFFFQSRNIVISRSTTVSYAQFIIANIRKTLQKSIERHPDADMIWGTPMSDMDLFWL
jgi:hypothetical protein